MGTKAVWSKLTKNQISSSSPKNVTNILNLPFLNPKIWTIMRIHKIHALWRKWLFAVFVKSLLCLPHKHIVGIAFAKFVFLNISWSLAIAQFVRLPSETRSTTQTKQLTILLKGMWIVWERVKWRNIREGNKKQKITKQKKRKLDDNLV